MCWDISAWPCSIVDNETDEGESGMVVATEDRRGRRLLSESDERGVRAEGVMTSLSPSEGLSALCEAL